MLDQVGRLVQELKGFVGELDAGGLNGDEAMQLCARFAEVERLGAAGRIVAAERVVATDAWRRGGSRSAADWLARESGGDRERARGALETAGRLEACPVVAAELRAGRLSEGQAQVIVDAAGAAPGAEERLVDFAHHNSLRQLRLECRRVKTATVDGAEEHKAVHRTRQHRTWIGRDGAYCYAGRMTAEAGARIDAPLQQRKEQIFRAARREGRREPAEAYAADALLELVTEDRLVDSRPGRRTRPTAMVIIHVSYEAISRGSLAEGDVCEIKGVGPVPLDAARRLAADSILRILVTKGGQPMAVSPGVRTVPRALRLLIEARDQVCIVPGCDISVGLQLEHRKDFTLLGPTDMENCGLMCPAHHDMKTYLGYRLEKAADGSYTFTPPDDYLDLEPPDPLTGPTVFFNPWTGEPADPALRDPALRDPALRDGALDGSAGAAESGVPGNGAAPGPSAGRSPRQCQQPALAGVSGPAP
jgi:hypothetical protein